MDLDKLINMHWTIKLQHGIRFYKTQKRVTTKYFVETVKLQFDNPQAWANIIPSRLKSCKLVDL
jgi:hypothetical protein